MMELRIAKTRIFDAALVIVFVFECVCVMGEGVDGGNTPLPTRPQRYCDPASLVLGNGERRNGVIDSCMGFTMCTFIIITRNYVMALRMKKRKKSL